MSDMKPATEPAALSRREAIFQGLATTLGITAATAVAEPKTTEPEFVPENDYPFFGGEIEN